MGKEALLKIHVAGASSSRGIWLQEWWWLKSQITGTRLASVLAELLVALKLSSPQQSKL